MNLKEIPMANPDLGVLEEKAILDVYRSGWLGQGKKTREFEKLLSKFFSSNAIAVNSGSSAIMCALLAHGIKPGDSVVVPNFTFMSTASVPKILGAEIIPVDIDPATLNLDVQALEEVLKKKEIKFVIFVDVAGLANDIDSLVDLSKRYNFTLLEDAAEALGSEYKKKRLGSFDHTTIFSFHVAKQITTIEGGCITTKDEKLAKKISAIKDIGRTGSGVAGKGYKHDFIGSNFRITDILSTIGIVVGAAYFLWTLQRVFLGDLNPKYEAIEEINKREIATLIPLGILTIVLGIWPHFAIEMFRNSVAGLPLQ